MTCSPPHDSHDPLGYLNAVEMAVLSVRSGCLHCNVHLRMLPGPGTAWLMEEFHELTCPVNEDSGLSEAW